MIKKPVFKRGIEGFVRPKGFSPSVGNIESIWLTRMQMQTIFSCFVVKQFFKEVKSNSYTLALYNNQLEFNCRW